MGDAEFIITELEAADDHDDLPKRILKVVGKSVRRYFEGDGWYTGVLI